MTKFIPPLITALAALATVASGLNGQTIQSVETESSEALRVPMKTNQIVTITLY